MKRKRKRQPEKTSSFKIEWRTREQHEDSYYWCDTCGSLEYDSFAIVHSRDDWIVCQECMLALQAAISPLSVLVQTGKNTEE